MGYRPDAAPWLPCAWLWHEEIQRGEAIGHQRVSQRRHAVRKPTFWASSPRTHRLLRATLSAMRNIAAGSAWEFTASMSHSRTHRKCTREAAHLWDTPGVPRSKQLSAAARMNRQLELHRSHQRSCCPMIEPPLQHSHLARRLAAQL